MKPLKVGQLATLINKDRRIGCIIKVAKRTNLYICPECKMNNYEAFCHVEFCLMRFLDKSCPEIIQSFDLYPKVIKFFKIK